MLPLVNVPPELKEKMTELIQKCELECLEVMDRNLHGKMMLVVVSVYYEVMIRLLMGMADELEKTLNMSTDQTAEMIIEFVTKGVNLVKDDIKMNMQANTSQEGRA